MSLTKDYTVGPSEARARAWGLFCCRLCGLRDTDFPALPSSMFCFRPFSYKGCVSSSQQSTRIHALLFSVPPCKNSKVHMQGYCSLDTQRATWTFDILKATCTDRTHSHWQVKSQAGAPPLIHPTKARSAGSSESLWLFAFPKRQTAFYGKHDLPQIRSSKSSSCSRTLCVAWPVVSVKVCFLVGKARSFGQPSQ